jgi:hypothetical protein
LRNGVGMSFSAPAPCAKADVPAICWSRQSRLAFQVTQRFWPSPADVVQHMNKFANPMRRERLACRGIIQAAKVNAEALAMEAERAPPSAKALQAMSDAAKHVRSLAHDYKQKRASPFDVAPQIKPHYASEGHLRASLESQAANHPLESFREIARTRLAVMDRAQSTP